VLGAGVVQGDHEGPGGLLAGQVPPQRAEEDVGFDAPLGVEAVVGAPVAVLPSGRGDQPGDRMPSKADQAAEQMGPQPGGVLLGDGALLQKLIEAA